MLILKNFARKGLKEWCINATCIIVAWPNPTTIHYIQVLPSKDWYTGIGNQTVNRIWGIYDEFYMILFYKFYLSCMVYTTQS